MTMQKVMNELKKLWKRWKSDEKMKKWRKNVVWWGGNHKRIDFVEQIVLFVRQIEINCIASNSLWEKNFFPNLVSPPNIFSLILCRPQSGEPIKPGLECGLHRNAVKLTLIWGESNKSCSIFTSSLLRSSLLLGAVNLLHCVNCWLEAQMGPTVGQY